MVRREERKAVVGRGQDDGLPVSSARVARASSWWAYRESRVKNSEKAAASA
jgi:hypothetical protein